MLVVAVSPDRGIGLHGRPTGRTQFFVFFVTFVVENVTVADGLIRGPAAALLQPAGVGHYRTVKERRCTRATMCM